MKGRIAPNACVRSGKFKERYFTQNKLSTIQIGKILLERNVNFKGRLDKSPVMDYPDDHADLADTDDHDRLEDHDYNDDHGDHGAQVTPSWIVDDDNIYIRRGFAS